MTKIDSKKLEKALENKSSQSENQQTMSKEHKHRACNGCAYKTP